MPCRGHIRNAVVQPDEPLPWPEGTDVPVVPAAQNSLKNLLGLLHPEGPLPSDDECDQIREDGLLRRNS